MLVRVDLVQSRRRRLRPPDGHVSGRERAGQRAAPSRKLDDTAISTGAQQRADTAEEGARLRSGSAASAPTPSCA